MDKLSYKNNWEADEYYVGKKRVNSLKAVQINSTIFPVIPRTETVEYSDHGSPGTSTSVHYHIEVCVDGIFFKRDLNTLVEFIDVYALTWS